MCWWSVNYLFRCDVLDIGSMFRDAMSASYRSVGELEVFVASLSLEEKALLAKHTSEYCRRFSSSPGEANTVIAALNDSLALKKVSGVPPVTDEVNDQSDFVLVSLIENGGLVLCCYSHELDGWIDNKANFYSNNEVFEWWPAPAKGSGKSPVVSNFD